MPSEAEAKKRASDRRPSAAIVTGVAISFTAPSPPAPVPTRTIVTPRTVVVPCISPTERAADRDASLEGRAGLHGLLHEQTNRDRSARARGPPDCPDSGLNETPPLAGHDHTSTRSPRASTPRPCAADEGMASVPGSRYRRTMSLWERRAIERVTRAPARASTVAATDPAGRPPTNDDVNTLGFRGYDTRPRTMALFFDPNPQAIAQSASMAAGRPDSGRKSRSHEGSVPTD